MEIIRQFQKMSLWDFIDLLESNCLNCGSRSNYFMYLDEIKMRRIESISEGGNHKLKALAIQLLEAYEVEMKKESSFSTEKEFEEFSYTVNNEI